MFTVSEAGRRALQQANGIKRAVTLVTLEAWGAWTRHGHSRCGSASRGSAGKSLRSPLAMTARALATHTHTHARTTRHVDHRGLETALVVPLLTVLSSEVVHAEKSRRDRERPATPEHRVRHNRHEVRRPTYRRSSATRPDQQACQCEYYSIASRLSCICHLYMFKRHSKGGAVLYHRQGAET